MVVNNFKLFLVSNAPPWHHNWLQGLSHESNLQMLRANQTQIAFDKGWADKYVHVNTHSTTNSLIKCSLPNQTSNAKALFSVFFGDHEFQINTPYDFPPKKHQSLAPGGGIAPLVDSQMLVIQQHRWHQRKNGSAGIKHIQTLKNIYLNICSPTCWIGMKGNPLGNSMSLIEDRVGMNMLNWKELAVILFLKSKGEFGSTPDFCDGGKSMILLCFMHTWQKVEEWIPQTPKAKWLPMPWLHFARCGGEKPPTKYLKQNKPTTKHANTHTLTHT